MCYSGAVMVPHEDMVRRRLSLLCTSCEAVQEAKSNKVEVMTFHGATR